VKQKELNLGEYLDTLWAGITRRFYDKPKQKKLPKLQTRLHTSKKKTNKLQRVQKKVRK
jgi:hypothetical protein